jgi:pimeloyl-ACP methyl ester carboxylesterase
MSPFGAPLHPNDIARIQKKFRIQNYAEAKQFMSRIHAADSYLTPAIALAALSHFNRPHLREMVDSLPQLQLLSAYELTNTPKSLLIWGNADVILPVYARDFFVRFMPLYATHQDDIFGHIPHLDAPSLLARYILNYLHQL